MTIAAIGPGERPALQVADGVATIRLQRPARRNSLRDDDLRWLLDTFAALDADRSVRLLVLAADTRGQPRPVFCAGYDVAGFDAADHDPRLFERVPDALEQLRPLTLCALNGSVYGGATDLALACDLRVGLAGSEFRMPACAIGLHYYPSGLRRYVSRLGLVGAQRAFLAAEPLSFEQLQTWGLFHTLADAHAFDGVLQRLVRQLAALAPLAVETTKRSLQEIAAGRIDLGRLREREALTQASADFAEGRAALVARRAPQFRGA